MVDHSRISADLGGETAFRDMARRFRTAGLGVIVDIVPNHMAIPVPESLNRPLWSVLRDGPDSEFASWFDVDWAAEDGRLLLPVLGGPLDDCLGDLTVARLTGPGGTEPVLRYFDHVFPLRPDTGTLPLADLLAEQYYRLADWRLAATELNWRRFFDISSLIAVRVEDPEVFEATHAVILGLVADGLIDGLRVDHPDGLADPRGYLAPAGRADRRAVGVHREDPVRRRAAARRLAVRGHHRLRQPRRGRRPVPRPGRGAAAGHRLRRVHRRPGRLRRGGRGGQAGRGRAGPGRRGGPAGPAGSASPATRR